MNLPFLKFFKKKVEAKYYLAFILRHEKALAVIFEQIGVEAKIVGKGEATFEKNIEEVSFEALLSASDKAISKAEENVPDNSDSLQTLFGLKESWIDDDKIKKEYLERLKKLSDQLGLAPIGFITVTEAIMNLVKKEEGVPVTAILAEIGKNYVTTSLIKAGKIMETKSSEIHESPAFTVDVLLKHFEIPEVLPSKVIIYDGGNEDLSQEFISHQWSKSLPFLHLPQIINLPDGFDAKAILQGAATKMGFEIIEGADPKNFSEEIPAFEEINIEKEKNEPKKEILEEKEANNEINFVESEDFVEKFGFFENEDVLKIPPSKTNPKEELRDISEEKDEDNFAVERGDEPGKKKEEIFADKSVEEEAGYENENKKTRKPRINLFRHLKKIKSFFVKSFSKIKLPKNKSLVIAGVLISALIILAIYFFLTFKATVTLSLNPKLDKQKQSVVFSKDNTDVDKKIINGTFVETDLEGTASTNTTGKKETGTQAKGAVTFYSRFTEERTIPAGTILTSTNDLDFTIDKAVNLGSASADASASPATANGNVTAKSIGKESNLPSGTKFNVGNLDTGNIIAKNESAFAGGTKKEITVVAKTDTEKLLDQIAKDLGAKAIENLSKKIDSKNILLPVVVDSTVGKKSFDKEIGDEASKLNLKATITFQGLSYSKKDLISFTKSLLKKELSSKLEIDENNIKVDVENVKKKDTEEISATLKIKAPLIPNFNKTEITNSIVGKSNEQAKASLLKLSQVASVSINPSIPIPFLTNFLPRFPSNVIIVTKINE
jgi:hypothetical protein